VQAQTDFSGEWAIRLHEDEPHRQAGPNAEVPGRHGIELGDYTGMPINAAARLMADSWDAFIQTLPSTNSSPRERRCGWQASATFESSKIVNDETWRGCRLQIFRSPGTTTTQ
jgi:hypothetical protein